MAVLTSSEVAARQGRFLGAANPRHLRVIAALLARPLPRENLDSVAGCANGPELVAELRRVLGVQQ